MPELEIHTVINVLQQGEITIKGEFIWGSNYTFLAEVCQNGYVIQGVYKPSRGERPLWDFPPSSLARREAAAYLVSKAIGWNFVPPTVYRKVAPIGPGSLQLYIEHDPEVNYFNMTRSDRQSLRPVVLFDLLVNNADRKGSHLLFDQNHHLWLIDHGICFHAEDKLRTVIWDFIGEPIPNNLRDDLRNFRPMLQTDTDFSRELRTLLKSREVEALLARLDYLVSLECFPQPEPDQRSFPWPLV